MSRITRDIEEFFPHLEPRKDEWGFHPLRWLQRHPVSIRAHFRHSLVLTYALPKTVLEPMLPPGLILDSFKDLGFVAIAMVDTKDLRPMFCPKALGRDFFLTGYRIFTRYQTRSGRTLRGLRILRSDANSRTMVCFGNRLTHYNYSLARVNFQIRDNAMEIQIETPRAVADLQVIAHFEDRPAALPEGSPFADLREARLFAGPLPYTFDYEKETHSIVMIEGVRKEWKPQPVAVEVLRNTFFDQSEFRGCKPVLANAFHVENIPYQWRRGIREALPKGAV